MTVKPGATALLTVRVVSPDGEAVADGTVVDLSAVPTLGTVVPAKVMTIAGAAQATFTAGMTAGLVTVTAAGEDALAEIRITIEGTPTVVRIVVGPNPSTCSTSLCIEGGVEGTLSGGGWSSGMIEPVSPGSSRDVVLPTGGRYEWLLKSCMQDPSLTNYRSYLMVWEDSGTFSEGQTVSLHLGPDNARIEYLPPSTVCTSDVLWGRRPLP